MTRQHIDDAFATVYRSEFADLVQSDFHLPNERGHRLLADIVAGHLDAMIMGEPGVS